MASAAEPQWGPALVGVYISLILYGIELCQTFYYYRSYPSDTRRLRCFVCFIVFADTIHAFFSMILIYNVLIINYNNPSYLNKTHWLFDAYPSFVGIISFAVQLFFAWRVRVLTRSAWLFGALSIICLSNLAFGLAVSVEAGKAMIFTDVRDFKRIVLIWLLISMTAEIILTGVLTWFLRKPALFLSSSNDLVKRISRLTLSNGLITTIWTLGDVLSYFEGGVGTHLIFCYPLAKLYIISMLSTLNTRPTFHETQMRARPDTLNLNDSQVKSGFSTMSFMRKRASSYSAVESQTPLPNTLNMPLVHIDSGPLSSAGTTETDGDTKTLTPREFRVGIVR